jgi:hypothetical protein
VRPDGPDIAGARHRHHRGIWHSVSSVRLVGICLLVGVIGFHVVSEQGLDLGILKTRQCKVVPRLRQLDQLQRKHLLVPARIERQPVVCDHQRALLRDAQMRQFDHRHLIQTQLAGSGQTSVPGNDAVVAIDQDRIRPAVLDDAGRDLGDLALGVRARIASVGNQRIDLAVLDVERVQSGFPKSKTRRALPPGGLSE